MRFTVTAIVLAPSFILATDPIFVTGTLCTESLFPRPATSRPASDGRTYMSKIKLQLGQGGGGGPADGQDQGARIAADARRACHSLPQACDRRLRKIGDAIPSNPRISKAKGLVCSDTITISVFVRSNVRVPQQILPGSDGTHLSWCWSTKVCLWKENKQHDHQKA